MSRDKNDSVPHVEVEDPKRAMQRTGELVRQALTVSKKEISRTRAAEKKSRRSGRK